jgi:hypothetical protein
VTSLIHGFLKSRQCGAKPADMYRTTIGAVFGAGITTLFEFCEDDIHFEMNI